MPKEGEQADLNFDGLDTFATVSRESFQAILVSSTHKFFIVNDTKILEADNMFLPYR